MRFTETNPFFNLRLNGVLSYESHTPSSSNHGPTSVPCPHNHTPIGRAASKHGPFVTAPPQSTDAGAWHCSPLRNSISVSLTQMHPRAAQLQGQA